MPAAESTRRLLSRIVSAVVLLTLSLFLHGCETLGYRDAIEDLANFTPLRESPQVRYAPGGQAFARRVATMLERATAQVEVAHARPFRSPPVVFVCGDEECFNAFVHPRWNFTAAVIYDNRLLLAPRLFDREPHRLYPILLHELSHLHLGQSRGHYTMDIPVWFHEGLASFVAAGGGADLVSDQDAWQAVADAKHFMPDEQHLPWERRMADSWKLPVSIFYRQSLLFLQALHGRDPDAFRRLLTLLQDGVDFDAAFAQAMQLNPARAASAFFAHKDCSAAGSGHAACVPAPAGSHSAAAAPAGGQP
jgi:hypothetical protein